MRISGFATFATLVALSGWLRLEAQVGKSDFWKVELIDPQEVTASVGDMVLVKPRTLPLVPANLKKTFEVIFDHERFALVAEQPSEGEGRMGKQYYFLTRVKGSGEITVQIRDEGRVVEAVKLKVTCR